MSTKEMAGKNIDLQPFPKLAWDKDKSVESLEKLGAYVVAEATSAAGWYSRKRVWKRRGARLFRLGAIFWTSLAGLVPLFGELLETKQGNPGINPIVGSIFIAFAGIDLALDRFLGCSSGWVRYMQTEQQIKKLLKSFRFDFSLAEVEWRSGAPDDEKIQEAVGMCRALIVQIDELVQRETNLWVAEFEGVLRQIDQAAKVSTDEKQKKNPS